MLDSKNYDEAYFEIKEIKVFGPAGSTTATKPSAASSAVGKSSANSSSSAIEGVRGWDRALGVGAAVAGVVSLFA